MYLFVFFFLQAVSISLFCAGFGESMAETTGWDSPWAVRVIGLVTSLILLVVVLAGVKWVVKLQLLLLAILMLSVLDFLVGTFAHTDYGKCKPGQVADGCEKISYLLNCIVQSGELHVRQLCSIENFSKNSNF